MKRLQYLKQLNGEVRVIFLLDGSNIRVPLKLGRKIINIDYVYDDGRFGFVHSISGHQGQVVLAGPKHKHKHRQDNLGDEFGKGIKIN